MPPGAQAADERPQQFVNMGAEELSSALSGVRDPNLRHVLQFGIGMHHAGLNEGDRALVEQLFVEHKIQASRPILPPDVEIWVWHARL